MSPSGEGSGSAPMTGSLKDQNTSARMAMLSQSPSTSMSTVMGKSPPHDQTPTKSNLTATLADVDSLQALKRISRGALGIAPQVVQEQGYRGLGWRVSSSSLSSPQTSPPIEPTPAVTKFDVNRLSSPFPSLDLGRMSPRSTMELPKNTNNFPRFRPFSPFTPSQDAFDGNEKVNQRQRLPQGFA